MGNKEKNHPQNLLEELTFGGGGGGGGLSHVFGSCTCKGAKKK